MQLAVRMAVNEHDERWRHAYAVAFDDSTRAAVVALHLDDLDAPCVLLRGGLKVRLELTAWRASVGVELDQHGALVVEDLALERGVVCLVDHVGSLGCDTPGVHFVRIGSWRP